MAPGAPRAHGPPVRLVGIRRFRAAAPGAGGGGDLVEPGGDSERGIFRRRTGSVRQGIGLARPEQCGVPRTRPAWRPCPRDRGRAGHSSGGGGGGPPMRVAPPCRRPDRCRRRAQGAARLGSAVLRRGFPVPGGARRALGPIARLGDIPKVRPIAADRVSGGHECRTSFAASVDLFATSVRTLPRQARNWIRSGPDDERGQGGQGVEPRFALSGQGFCVDLASRLQFGLKDCTQAETDR